MIEIYSVSRDEVIRSAVGQGRTEYGYAIDKLYPLINKFEEQRKIQRRRFYDRLRKDIVSGCIMPPITLAFVDRMFSASLNVTEVQDFVNKSIQSGYILDGMQRLNTLNDAMLSGVIQRSRPLYLNVVIAESYDLLLYRMITLKNGQKPMTARHQVEMLTKGVIDAEGLNLPIFTEKDSEDTKIPPGSFRQSDIVEAYMAFFTNNVNNQNSKIIESKLDEIIVGKVMDNFSTSAAISFSEILKMIEKFSHDAGAGKWLRTLNNLIGFAVGARKSYSVLRGMDAGYFSACLLVFEDAFSAMNVSKISVGKTRRELVRVFIEKIDEYGQYEVETLQSVFHDATVVD